MSIVSSPLTYADLERERAVTRNRLELIKGEIVATPSPTAWHQLISHRLAVALDHAVVESGLGIVLAAPVDVFFEDFTVLQPDLIALLQDRVRLFSRARIEGAPNLAIEVISRSTEARDREVKRNDYARFGVDEYWLVDPDAEVVTIFSALQDGQYHQSQTVRDVARSITIPGLTLRLAHLFRPVGR